MIGTQILDMAVPARPPAGAGLHITLCSGLNGADCEWTWPAPVAVPRFARAQLGGLGLVV